MILTKQTIFFLKETIDWSTLERDGESQAVQNKISELSAQNKTDGAVAYTYNLDGDNGLTKVIRNWVDQAAAEEWAAFVIDTEAAYNRAVVSYEIVDIPV